MVVGEGAVGVVEQRDLCELDAVVAEPLVVLDFLLCDSGTHPLATSQIGVLAVSGQAAHDAEIVEELFQVRIHAQIDMGHELPGTETAQHAHGARLRVEGHLDLVPTTSATHGPAYEDLDCQGGQKVARDQIRVWLAVFADSAFSHAYGKHTQVAGSDARLQIQTIAQKSHGPPAGV